MPSLLLAVPVCSGFMDVQAAIVGSLLKKTWKQQQLAAKFWCDSSWTFSGRLFATAISQHEAWLTANEGKKVHHASVLRSDRVMTQSKSAIFVLIWSSWPLVRLTHFIFCIYLHVSHRNWHVSNLCVYEEVKSTGWTTIITNCACTTSV